VLALGSDAAYTVLEENRGEKCKICAENCAENALKLRASCAQIELKNPLKSAKNCRKVARKCFAVATKSFFHGFL